MNRKQKIMFLFIGRTVESAVTAGMFFFSSNGDRPCTAVLSSAKITS